MAPNRSSFVALSGSAPGTSVPTTLKPESNGNHSSSQHYLSPEDIVVAGSVMD